MAEKDGGPAFPGFDPNSEAPKPTEGMSLRDYFAGQVVASIAIHGCQQAMRGGSYKQQALAMAELSYTIADAMLSARQSDGVSHD